MRELIEERRTSGNGEEHFDLFSNLLDANADSEDSSTTKLSDDELIGTFPGKSVLFRMILIRLYRQRFYNSACWS